MPTDAGTQLTLVRAARGEQLIALMGCQSCHGEHLRGGVVAHEAGRFRIVAPDLVGGTDSDATRYANDWRALRLGLDDDQRALWAMPRTALLQLADDDVLALCDALVARRRATRAQAHGPVPWPRGFVGGPGYLDLLRGTLVLVDDAVPAPPPDGWPTQPPPSDDLAAARAYEQRIRTRRPASIWPPSAAAAHQPSD